MSNQNRHSRRTVINTVGSLGVATLTTSVAASADSNSDETPPEASPGATASPAAVSDGATRYVGVVDRIVDGEHVVLLLEKDGDLVDQHVEPRSELEAVDEGDILQVVIKDGELLTAQQIPNRPGRSATGPSPQDRFDPLASELDSA